MELLFKDGQPHPACDVRVNQKFKSYHAIQLMMGGSMYFQREGHELAHFNAPTFFWTEVNSLYLYGPGETGTWEQHWIQLSGEAIDQHYINILEDLAPKGYVGLFNGEHVCEAFMELIRSIHVPTNSFTRLHQLHRILARVDEGRISRRNVDTKIIAIQKEMDAYPERDYEFQKMAIINGYSYSSFRRGFRELTGIPPQRYLLARRMQKAAQLLLQTRETIQDIGFRFGYENPSYFSRAFKQHSGLSPKAYRMMRFSDYSPGLGTS